MKKILEKLNNLSQIHLAIGMLIGWSILSCLYLKLVHTDSLKSISGFIPLVSQIIVDMLIASISFLLMKKAINKYKKIFFYFGLAFLIEIITDSTLNWNISILNNFPLSTLTELIIEVPFYIFHIFLFTSYLLMLKSNEIDLSKRKLYSRFELLPFLFVISIIFYFLVFSYQWKISVLSVSGIIQVGAIILNLMVFLPSIICLASSNNFSILCIATGTLFLVTADIIDRFNALNDTYMLSADMNNVMWLLGSLIVLYGLLLLKKSKIGEEENSKFLLPIKSVQVQYTLWCFLVSVFSLSAFVLIIMFFLDKNDYYHNEIVTYISSVLIIFSAISVLSSSIFAKKMAIPFQKIKSQLDLVANTDYEDMLRDNKAHTPLIKNDKIDILEFEQLSNFITKAFYAYQEKASIEKTLSKTALQVAHDIRSPLTVLDVVVKDITNIPEDQRILIRTATNSIHDIANNLLSQYKNTKIDSNKISSNKTSELMVDLLLSVISEKRAQYKNKGINFLTHIDDLSYNGFIKVSASTFKRVISNLLNNAVEAQDPNSVAVINIFLSTCTDGLKLAIQDHGCGIPPDLLQKIKRGEVATQKEQGNGLGLSSAIKIIENEWEGQLSIQSGVNQGTEINIFLKRAPVPNWFLSELTYLEGNRIVILDDDESIHLVWRKRFEKIMTDVHFVDFYNPNDLIKAYRQQQLQQSILFLIDYELIGYDMTGLDVIKELHIAQNSHLVTSRYEDAAIQNQCEKLDIKIIPKNIASHIPITLLKADTADCIFIDDDEALTQAWAMHGENVGKHVATFNKTANFRAVMRSYKKDIPIYIDSDLGEDLAGDEFAKELSTLGFTNLYLSTGHPESHFEKMPWIKGILDKKPPF